MGTSESRPMRVGDQVRFRDSAKHKEYGVGVILAGVTKGLYDVTEIARNGSEVAVPYAEVRFPGRPPMGCKRKQLKVVA